MVCHSGQIEITITDNGCGFQTEIRDQAVARNETDRSRGLAGLNHRLRSLGGECRFTPPPTGHAQPTVKLILPLPQHHDGRNVLPSRFVEKMKRSARQIVRYLTAQGGFVCVGQYGRAQDALARLPTESPAVVLMDIKMKGMDGIECVRRLKEKMPEILVIMLTVFDDDDLIFDALMAGASGYLLKRQPPESLLEAIRELLAGGSPMSATIARKVVRLLQRSAGPVKPGDATRWLLSDRQREILERLAAGESYKIIADKMGLSIHTVRGYIRRIYEKLQVHTRTEAVAKYLRR